MVLFQSVKVRGVHQKWSKHHSLFVCLYESLMVSHFLLSAQQCPVAYIDSNVLVNGDPEEATYGNVLRFSCKSNLEILDGPAEIYCNENGEWSGTVPKCKGKWCKMRKGIRLLAFRSSKGPRPHMEPRSRLIGLGWQLFDSTGNLSRHVLGLHKEFAFLKSAADEWYHWIKVALHAAC